MDPFWCAWIEVLIDTAFQVTYSDPQEIRDLLLKYSKRPFLHQSSKATVRLEQSIPMSGPYFIWPSKSVTDNSYFGWLVAISAFEATDTSDAARCIIWLLRMTAPSPETTVPMSAPGNIFTQKHERQHIRRRILTPIHRRGPSNKMWLEASLFYSKI